MLRSLLAALLILTVQLSQTAGASDLPRRAKLGFALEASGQSLKITDIDTAAPAASAGLKSGDEIAAINGATFSSAEAAQFALERIPPGKQVQLSIRRNGAARAFSFVPQTHPVEVLAGMEVTLGSLDVGNGAVLRTIVARPETLTQKAPGIFFVQWVSCETVEFHDDAPWINLFRRVAEQSGAIFYRVERSTSGDSIGLPCNKLDLQSELSQYRQAFKAFIQRPDIDPNRVAIIGNSLGSNLVPLIPEGFKVAAAIATSGGTTTYLERMLAFDSLEIATAVPDAPKRGPALVNAMRFQLKYLLERKTPVQIEREAPELKDVWRSIYGLNLETHYGRPFAYHWQAAGTDFLSAWLSLPGAKLFVFNEFDNYESRQNTQNLVDQINRAQPGSADLRLMPNLNHSFYRYETRQAWLAKDRSKATDGSLAASDAILNWLKAKRVI